MRRNKPEFKETWPSFFMLEKIKLMVDKYARIDKDTLEITYKVRDYHTREYEDQWKSKVWIEKKMSKEEANLIFQDLYPEGSLVL